MMVCPNILSKCGTREKERNERMFQLIICSHYNLGFLPLDSIVISYLDIRCEWKSPFRITQRNEGCASKTLPEIYLFICFEQEVHIMF